MEAELFGTVRGAFTGAIDKPGKLELADGGTLFLDEIADIPLSAQTKLLRVLQDGVLERVGGTKHVKTDFRLVSATNKDLDEAIRNGKFREDLYDRIKGITIRIPPLRERMEDIPLLVLDTLGKLGSSKVFEPSAIELMQAYSWPGNIRQLIRFVEVVDVLCDSQEVRAKDLQPLIRISPPQVSSSLIKTEFPTLKTLVAQVERGHSALRADSSTFTPCSGTGSWGG